MDLQLAGKVAIVTGGSRGIGKAIGRALAREGASVALVGRDSAALDAACAEIGKSARPFIADTGDDAAVKSMVDAVAAAFGRIDILVNCAAKPGAQGKVPTLAEITGEMLWDDLNVKVMGYMRTAREVLPHMKRQGGGRIVNISGGAARTTGSITGSVRNVGVVALTKNMAEELAPHGITAVCVHPGLTRTEKTPDVQARQAKAQGVTVADIEKKMASRNLINKLLSADEVADVVAFLASPKALPVNGDVVSAGGGAAGAIYY